MNRNDFDKWRLIDTGILTGAQNMALDDVILECHAYENTPNTIRFLQFNPSTALVGYHQSIEQEIRIDFCKHHGIDINRRLTGGGAILFTPTCLGWEVFADKSVSRIRDLRTDLDKLAQLICEGTVRGLQELGIEAEFRPKNDIEVNGRKISGTGGTEREDSFMYQGTLLVDFDVELMLRALRIPVEKLQDKEIESVKERVTCLKWELGRVPPLADIKRAIADGFQEVLDIQLQDRGLYPIESEMYNQKLPEFESEDWINMVRKPLDWAGTVSTMRKTPGGLIRASLSIDIPGNYIVSSFITGDFQVFPQRAIMDLESTLKNSDASYASIRNNILDFFESSRTRIFGIPPEIVADTIIEAVKKKSFVNYGFTLDDSNQLMTVNFLPDELEQQHFDFVLLPYCAKLLGCEYRFVEGCSMCGGCSTNDVYKQITELNVPVRTIQNFEDLVETVHEFKEKGARGYVGSCCDAFYSKHYQDFVDMGVPALLVDVDDSTCYDLGEEEKAYEGTFEGQTVLKTDLILKVINTLTNMGILHSGVVQHRSV